MERRAAKILEGARWPSNTLYSPHTQKPSPRYLLVMADANALKDQGNKAFAAKDWDKAIDLFSQAIAIDGSNHVLYSNRSAAYSGKRNWDEALKDAEKVRDFSTFGRDI
ncbi:hypothetical protein GYMLUDRAFT_367459 [Collybiopsis luxurians FD-317 M1]|nr:hypothetical protein GYMLUDRAFT_367459 [Collybiopsis luxurians FD-317 M1]